MIPSMYEKSIAQHAARHSTAQHAQHRTEPYPTALRCWAADEPSWAQLGPDMMIPQKIKKVSEEIKQKLDRSASNGRRRCLSGRSWEAKVVPTASAQELLIVSRAPIRRRLTPPYIRARNNTTKCQGGRRGPWLGATSDQIMPIAACAELAALCCAVCLLAMSLSDRQYECNLQTKKTT